MTAPAVLSHALNPDALRAARRTAGYSLQQAAARLGCSFSGLSRYERGEIDPPASRVAALADLYGVHPGDFFRPTT
jgi:transcriptional regulator with XRE-family HTH domain